MVVAEQHAPLLVPMRVAPNLTITTRHNTMDAYVVREHWRAAPLRRRGGQPKRTPGTYERYIHVTSEDRWLDGGAHIGAFTLWLLNQDAAHVLAVEAEPSNYALLQHNLRTNPQVVRTGRVTAVQAALWPYPTARVPLYLNSHTNTGGHSLIVKRGRQAVLVPTMQLFSGIVNYGCNCLKLDVEGSELALLENLPDEGWRRLRCLVMEFHFNALHDKTHEKYARMAQLLRAHFPHTLIPQVNKHWQVIVAAWR